MSVPTSKQSPYAQRSPQTEEGRVVIVGRGRVGAGLASWFRSVGALVDLLEGRAPVPRDTEDENLSDARAVILAVPDGAVEHVASQFLNQFPDQSQARPALLHCAGSLGVEAFGSARASTKGLGVFHPLISFATPSAPPPLHRPTFAIAGDEKARAVACELAATLGGSTLAAEDGTSIVGPAYHAAAAMTANGTAALALLSRGILSALGLRESASHVALASLLRSVAHNLETLGMPDALTGPVMRGDVAAVAKHREALAALGKPDAQLVRSYDEVGRIVLAAAREAGLEQARADELARLFASDT